ncbi:uncharacterized protein M6B38_369460 [Iris pallida]|uniref:Glycosyltransferase n=1 Tax=Iris pallida TaxID=29817 RepID=A0AAX6GDP1_IRIPA|nr:uncharacterized protein M6B38_369460 [Iris pallida]
MARQQHIVMFPFMAQGHIIPFLALAKLIAQRHPALTVTLLNTPLNIQSLQSSNVLHPSNVHLKSLPYRGTDFGLPPGAENTDSLPLPSIIRIFDSSESLQPHLVRFLSELTRENNGQPPLLIIADVFLGWTVDVARSLGVPHASFTTCGAFGTAAYMSLWLHLPHVAAPPGSREFNVPGFPEAFKLQTDQMSSYMRAADGSDPWSRFFRRQITRSLRSDAIVCNTVEEVETEGLRLLRRNAGGGLRVFPVGPLLPLESNSSHDRSGRKSGVEVGCIVKWLDSHESGSVVFVSFGSQNTVSASQMMSLAAGLEASGHPFVWVVRPPLGFDLSSEFRPEWLPQGFEERMRASGKGVLIRRWAPQLEILSHGSTGAFLSHCGWNSVLESLSRGVCIIGWPLASEQFYNSKMVEEELRVGTELARGTVEEVRSEAVEAAVRLVIEGDEGREMKERASKYRRMIREAMREEGEVKGSSIRSVDELIEMAMSSSRSTSVQ